MILISNPTPVIDETIRVNAMFDAGLPIFHLRKPDSLPEEIDDFLTKISPKYLSQIAIHQYHFLAEKWHLKRLHFTVKQRNSTNITDFENYRNQGFILSTSVHSVEEFNHLNFNFDYVFLSPVFDSISKINYTSVVFDLSKINNFSFTKLVALGGINISNRHEIYKMGFDDYALLGSIWQSENPLNAVKSFILK
ncbi:MAG: thiamine phosphate synthase [Pseudarcicella sp.]|nr:thiamine phosphate synthase [Pseudarcicella sp.]MBP6411505.1 thiamine phosphate synthase [Pseudarcicella sp.]